ncbi:hypothetical protein ACRE_043180 [Hapsidospora chrysogenum ATCC 11550]|uniref:Uncharacterized protein n=1 Tax=Hapsidospora chrysogenum (strain ATCC 11550 / CBS 779.69 / DSM 880 / IAM 14645 / JCM 23072 / IMI 49137) TaxID=857340 RepID=A0A086T6A1_HAPC1|nr:hypothetical protein ACRE_043180 [Hapsidospora chrysogenum ATCC 11550]
MALNHQITIRLRPQIIRSLRWRSFTTSKLQLPPDAIKKGKQWAVFEFTVQRLAFRGWPMPFQAQNPEADKLFQ